MFKHILIPTDGSPLSAKAIAAGIALAKESGARITGYHVLEAVPARLYAFPYRGEEEAIAEFEQRRRTRRASTSPTSRAPRASRACVRAGGADRAHALRRHRKAAQERDCDLILMSSHGRRGLARLAVGSVTDKVIQLSKVPVLVYR
jgi:nucleotide-binding universal stress UspA family protein